MSARMIEGVPYYRFRVSFRLANGRRRSWLRWSAGAAWFANEISRELSDRFSSSELPPGSNVQISQVMA